MAYDEALANRIRQAAGDREGFAEIKMFGGICFTLNGNMFAGVIRNDLMIRVGADANEGALAKPGVRPMDFAGRPMVGMVYVAPDVIEADESLNVWLDQGLAFAAGLPAKAPRGRPGPWKTRR